jgi:hypothetical protein
VRRAMHWTALVFRCSGLRSILETFTWYWLHGAGSVLRHRWPMNNKLYTHNIAQIFIWVYINACQLTLDRKNPVSIEIPLIL